MKVVGFLSLGVALLLQAVIALGQSSQPPRTADWDKIVEAGRKEGKVVASIPPSAELRKLMELTFPKRYGIGVEFVPARGGNVIRRMVDEANVRMARVVLNQIASAPGAASSPREPQR